MTHSEYKGFLKISMVLPLQFSFNRALTSAGVRFSYQRTVRRRSEGSKEELPNIGNALTIQFKANLKSIYCTYLELNHTQS